MATICLGCLNPLPDGDTVCRICGFSANDQNPDHALKVGTVLQEHYTVGRLVHEGSDSLSYLGYDEALKEPCFIQEYRPATLSRRNLDGQVVPLGGCERLFEDYKTEFRATMRALARAKDIANVIPIYDIFEENNSCYAVSDYCEGETLSRKITRAGGRIPWPDARPMFMSLMTCVEQLAGAHVHHLAICPDNIIITKDGKPHLRDFSIAAARRVGSDLQPHLASGYAAPEQYDMDGFIGEATDVYGLAATIFRTVTGNEPPAGNNRAEDSDDLFMSAEIAEELTQEVCIALFNALQVSPDDRTASAADFHRELSMEPKVSALLDEHEVENKVAIPKKKKELKQLRAMLIIFASVLAVIGVAIAVIAVLLGDREPPESSEPPASLPDYVISTTTTRQPLKYSVPDLVGKNYADVHGNKAYENFTVEIKYMEYNNKAKWTILSQEPAVGESVDLGDTIKIVVSLGKKEIEVPDLAGWKEEHAKLYLEALGFKVEIAKLYVSNTEKGCVEDTDPPAGTVKQAGDTITLRVSYVEPVISIPSDPTDITPPSDPTSAPTDVYPII